MTIGTTIIQNALKQISAFSVMSPPTPEAINDGLYELNSMMEMWQSKGIQLGVVPLEVPGDDLHEPPDTTTGIQVNLALQMAPYFSTARDIVTPTLIAKARDLYNDIYTLYRVMEIPDKVISSTTPIGTGNRIGVNNLNYFTRGTKLSSSDS